jgi:dethiobiotin synthetase/malonyl-CoA O-methyltransferase
MRQNLPQHRGLFVTGTDTDVGKTVASAVLMQRYGQTHRLRYWKPIQTGIEQDDDTETVRDLGACAEQEIFDEGVRLGGPYSPHWSAHLAGTSIELQPLLDRFAGQEPGAWVVEGAGGVLVPINEADLMIDLMSQLNLPALVVARSGLGTINHTLLTLGALDADSVAIAGVVMVGDPNAANREAIEHYGDVEVVTEMPMFEELTADVVGDWARESFDREGRLEKFLRA